jgi:type IV secretion system protein TrbB
MTETSLSAERRRVMLQTAMGPEIAKAFADDKVIEIMVNPDGALRLDRLGEGCRDTGVRLTPAQVERIIRLVASHARFEVHSTSPIVSAELPPHGDSLSGERFEGLLPPVSTAPCFSIRKPAAMIYGLNDYVADGLMTRAMARDLRFAVTHRQNILIAGGTSSGKTTLANALLAEIAGSPQRIILIEDTRELQCAAKDTVALRTHHGHVTMRDLVRSTLRLRPDRIIVGEVRGSEALDMLKCWNTGHPGGIATVHANSAAAALSRLEQLVAEGIANVPKSLIADAVDLIVFISGRGLDRRVASLVTVSGLTKGGDYDLFAQASNPPPAEHQALQDNAPSPNPQPGEDPCVD